MAWSPILSLENKTTWKPILTTSFSPLNLKTQTSTPAMISSSPYRTVGSTLGSLVGSVLPGAKALVDSAGARSFDPYKQFLATANQKYSQPLVSKTPEGLALNREAAENTANLVMGFINPGKIPSKLISKLPVKPGILPQTSFPPNLTSSLKSSVPPEMNPVNKIIQALKEAAPVRKGQEKLYSAERAKRVAKIASIGERVGGEQGYFSQLGALKGELLRKQFEGIRSKLTQTDIDSLFNTVEGANITPFEKISAKTGLSNLLGAEGGKVPTVSEMQLLGEIFPPEFVKAIMEKRPLWEKIKQNLADALNVPRSLMASFDVSAPLRQGIFMVGRPKQWGPAFGGMFKALTSEKAYKNILDEIASRPTYQKMREAKLALTSQNSVSLGAREEQFMSNLAEQIPGIGKVVRASDRAYTGFLNKLRADVFDDLLKKSNELGIEQTSKLTDDIAKFVNSATGRGELPDFLKGAGPLLNGTFFSPRLMASRLNLLNPVYYTSLDPFVRKEALKSLLTFGGLAATTLSLAKLGGADVETDPTSSDFAKIKVGDTRYDILGGFQQYIRLAGQLVAGKVTSSTSGREITLGEGYKPLTRKDVLLRFFESKENPIISFLSGLTQGQTALGEDFDPKTEAVNRFMPMALQDMYDLWQDKGLDGLIGWLPAPFGVGAQTYGKQELVYGQNRLGEETSQVRPVQGLGEKISEKLFGQQPLGTSKSFNVETYLKQLKSLPKEEAAKIFDEISKSNPDLAKQIVTAIKEEEKGITPHDKDLKSKGVASGDRAIAIVKDLEKLKTKEEKAQLWEEYVRKGVLTKDVIPQVMKLLNASKLMDAI